MTASHHHAWVLHLTDAFATLIEQFMMERNQTDCRARFRDTFVLDRRYAIKRIAREHGTFPPSELDTGPTLRGGVCEKGIANHSHD